MYIETVPTMAVFTIWLFAGYAASALPPMTPEMTRFEPPADVSKEAPPFIYAVTAADSPRVSLPQKTLDNDSKTVWVAQHNKSPWLTYHLSSPTKIDKVQISSPDKVKFSIRTSSDGRQWTTVFTGASSGNADTFETYKFESVETRYVRIAVQSSTKRHWHSISEVKIGGLEYKPTPEMQWWSKRWESGLPSDEYLTSYKKARRESYSDMAAKCVTTLIKKGTDNYGSVQSPIWVLNLGLETMNCFPQYNDVLAETAAKSPSYSSKAPYGMGYRAIRTSQRPAGCSNLFVDQPMIRAAVLQDLFSGRRTFTPDVERYIRWYFDHLMNEKTGLMEWGVHVSYDVFEEKLRYYDGYQHEVMCILPIWPFFYQVDSEATKAYLAKFWYWHTDQKTGQVDRHATRGHGLDFAMAAGEIILACAYLHTKNPDSPWLDRALQIAHSHWDSRDKNTNLFVNTPCRSPDTRFDSAHSDTSVTGLWASRVLMAGRITGNKELTDMAKKILLAWAKYGWDNKAKKPWASLRPDGTPNTKPRDYSGISYDKFDPSSHWDFWKDYVYGFEYPWRSYPRHGEN